MKSSLRNAGQRVLVGLGAGVVAVVVVAGPALADAVIHVKASQVPTQADTEEFNNGEDCDAAGQIPPGYDAWHLVLGGNNYTFVEVTGEFAPTKDGPTTFTAVAPGPFGVLPESGKATGKHVYLFAPAGMWMTDAIAKIDGEGDLPQFNISHTCPGTPQTPSPSVSVTPSTSTSPSTSASPSESASPSPSTSASPTSSPEPSESASPSASASASPTASSGGGGDDLPVTGSDLTRVLAAGLLLLVSGAAIVFIARRRIARQ